jgi:hypothetical protein
MSADIIPFAPRGLRIPPLRETCRLLRFPERQPDDLTMDHADTTPCEFHSLCSVAYDDEESA